jgi:hypothetical protein
MCHNFLRNSSFVIRIIASRVTISPSLPLVFSQQVSSHLPIFSQQVSLQPLEPSLPLLLALGRVLLPVSPQSSWALPKPATRR